jgi:hypothetical protein
MTSLSCQAVVIKQMAHDYSSIGGGGGGGGGEEHEELDPGFGGKHCRFCLLNHSQCKYHMSFILIK